METYLSENLEGFLQMVKKLFFMYLFIYFKKKVAITVEARPDCSLWLNLPQDELIEG